MTTSSWYVARGSSARTPERTPRCHLGGAPRRRRVRGPRRPVAQDTGLRARHGPQESGCIRHMREPCALHDRRFGWLTRAIRAQSGGSEGRRRAAPQRRGGRRALRRPDCAASAAHTGALCPDPDPRTKTIASTASRKDSDEGRHLRAAMRGRRSRHRSACTGLKRTRAAYPEADAA